MKKLVSALLAGAMVLSLAACGGGGGSSSSKPAAGSNPPAAGSTPAGSDPAGSDPAASAASEMKIAMVTDSGDITDQSFNQTTYETAKAWSEANGASFKYFKPEKDTDEARNASIDQAIADGANIIILPGYMFAPSLVAQTGLYPDVKFIGLDVGAGKYLSAVLLRIRKL